MIIIANWKMSLSLSQSKILAKDLVDKFDSTSKEIVVCPDFISLESVGNILFNGEVKLGAQDVFWENFGSYTGEISCKVLEEAGCEYVIIGHSERREYLRESNEIINNKAKRIIETSALTPIICIGESLREREAGSHELFLEKQIQSALSNIDVKNKIIIAYEPIWAIGSGKPIQAKDAERIHKMIYNVIENMLGVNFAKNNLKIIYGGSVKSQNVESFIGLEKMDGFLVGGASLDADEFLQIANLAIRNT